MQTNGQSSHQSTQPISSVQSAPNQRIALLIDSETLEITVENMYASNQSDRKMMYYPEWRSIVNDVVEDREVIRMIYYKKQAKPINTKFEKMWTEELGGEVR